MLTERRAASFDLDGVIFPRIPVQSAVFSPNKKRSNPYFPGQEIPVLDRTASREPLSGLKVLELMFHRIRPPFPDAKRAILETKGVDMYGNTGRPNHIAWISMTKKTLGAELANKLLNIFFTPEGVKNTMGKLSTIAYLLSLYDGVDHFEDNPGNGVPIATVFPNVRVFMVRDLSTDVLLPQKVLDKHPNLVVASNLREALELAYH